MQMHPHRESAAVESRQEESDHFITSEPKAPKREQVGFSVWLRKSTELDRAHRVAPRRNLSGTADIFRLKEIFGTEFFILRKTSCERREKGDKIMKEMENTLLEVATRIRGLRDVLGFSAAQMAEKTGLDEALYLAYEAGEVDLPFTFIHKCAKAFGVDLSELLEGKSAKLSS